MNDARLFTRRQPAAATPYWFTCSWNDLVFVHFSLPPKTLQPFVPFPLQILDDRAWVSLVAFTLADLAPHGWARWLNPVFGPFRVQHFLNVRTYVSSPDGSETGICFLREWIDSWFSLAPGRLLYGLPYHLANFHYETPNQTRPWRVEVHERGPGRTRSWSIRARLRTSELHPVPAGSLEEALLEKYAAFNCRRGVQRRFEVSHPPWRQCHVEVERLGEDLLHSTFPWWQAARFEFAQWSPGFQHVVMSGHQTLAAGVDDVIQEGIRRRSSRFARPVETGNSGGLSARRALEQGT